MSRPIHLCGSVPLNSSREVFEAVASTLGDRVARIPDGETGDRLDWLQWQTKFLRQCPQLEEIVVDSPYRGRQIQFQKRADVPADQLKLGPLGYSETAIQSYSQFAKLKQSGKILASTQFLVSLPTPLACTRVHIASASQEVVEPAYEQAMRNEIAAILDVIPASELALQWDVAVEFSILETRPGHFEDRFNGIVERLAARIDEIPTQVSAGLHLCYGDSGHKHFKEPEDTSRLVEVSNAVTSKVDRSINWIHLPVPKERDDERYFAPLRDMILAPGIELYLGLIHMTDGVEGAKRRIAAARPFVPKFGIGTECGFGRRPSETIPTLLELHRLISEL